MENKYLSQIVSQAGGQERSIRWFQRKVREVGVPTQRKLIEEGNRILSPTTGRMYFFMYDPKHKKTLPYYDRFPLVIPFEEDNNSFIGLNFHYISIPFRMALMEDLSLYRREVNNESRRMFKWRQIRNIREARPTIKKYLKKHVRSPFIELEEEELKLALLLPVYDFKKAAISKVYYDSRRKIYS